MVLQLREEGLSLRSCLLQDVLVEQPAMRAPIPTDEREDVLDAKGVPQDANQQLQRVFQPNPA